MPKINNCFAIIWLSTLLVAGNRTVNAQRVEPFRLPDIDGQAMEVAFQGDTQLTVVCFLGTECPLAKLYGPRLAKLAQRFASQKVRFVGINSNRQDSMDELRNYTTAHGIQFSMAKDYDNVVADQFGALRTPEVFVLDRDRSVQYQGRIDDQYLPGIARAKPSRSDLRIATSILSLKSYFICQESF